jgi:hypothetical protein
LVVRLRTLPANTQALAVVLYFALVDAGHARKDRLHGLELDAEVVAARVAAAHGSAVRREEARSPTIVEHAWYGSVGAVWGKGGAVDLAVATSRDDAAALNTIHLVHGDHLFAARVANAR